MLLLLFLCCAITAGQLIDDGDLMELQAGRERVPACRGRGCGRRPRQQESDEVSLEVDDVTYNFMHRTLAAEPEVNETEVPCDPDICVAPYFQLCERIHMKLSEYESRHPELRELRTEFVQRLNENVVAFEEREGHSIVPEILDLVLRITLDLRMEFLRREPKILSRKPRSIVEPVVGDFVAEEEDCRVCSGEGDGDGAQPLQVGSIRGIPGVHFPNYSEVPMTSFSCRDKAQIPGFYADLETGCQVFHVCYPHRRESFLCPVGTVFNQPILACDYWYNSDCSRSPHYYGIATHVDEEVSQEEEVEIQEIITNVVEEGNVDKPTPAIEKGVLADLLKFLPVKSKVVEYPQTSVKPILLVKPMAAVETFPAFGIKSKLAGASIPSTKAKISAASFPAAKVAAATIPITKAKIAAAAIPFTKAKIAAAAIPITKAKIAAAAVPIMKAKFAAATFPITKAKVAAAAIPIASAKVAAAAKAKFAAAAIPITSAKIAAAAIPVTKAKVAAAAVPLTKVKIAAAAVPIMKAKVAAAAIPIKSAKLAAAAIPITKVKLAAAAIPIKSAKIAAAAIPITKAKIASAAIPITKAKFAAAAIPVMKAKVAAVPFIKAKAVSAAAIPVKAKVASAAAFKVASAGVPIVKAKAMAGAALPLAKAKMAAAALPVLKVKAVAPALAAAKVLAAKKLLISPLTKKALAIGYMKLLKAKKLALIG